MSLEAMLITIACIIAFCYLVTVILEYNKADKISTQYDRLCNKIDGMESRILSFFKGCHIE